MNGAVWVVRAVALVAAAAWLGFAGFAVAAVSVGRSTLEDACMIAVFAAAGLTVVAVAGWELLES